MDGMQTIEINGVKLEIDLRTAKKVESYRVGDRVKVLVKEYSNYTPYPGVIVGFDAFRNLPTITVAYVKTGYQKADLEFAYINASEKSEVEIAPYHADILIDRERVEESINRAITEHEKAILDLRDKKAYFDQNFARYFTEIDDPASRIDGTLGIEER